LARILIATFGSFGDLYPYLAVGTELKRRGHAVTIASSATHRAKVEAEELAFHPVRPDVELDNRELLAYVVDARHGSERVVRYVAERVQESYEDTLEAGRHTDAILTHPLTFGAVLVAQKLSLPWISTVLAPISFFSAYDPPVSPRLPWMYGLRVFGPGFMKRFWDWVRRRTLEWVKPVLELRRELGLGSGEHPLFEGSHSPSLVLALFSRQLADPQPDWPPNTVATGFPFHDRGELTSELRQFLAEGPPPVVFTLGSSAVGAAGSFYVQSLAAIRRVGCRAVFLTGPHPQGLPDELPAGVMTSAYAPHGVIFPRAAAIVHQGGIGTTAQAMRSGRPAIVVPFANDQFDNAARVRRRCAAEVVYRSRYNSRRLARTLRRLLLDRSYAEAAAQLSRQVKAEAGATSAADAIESRIAKRGL
jgi:rhamnosyltransferase subunit B